MTYNKDFYERKKQKIQNEFQKAQQKYFQICELSGREYISFQERIVELNEKLKELDIEEKNSQEQDKKK